MARTQLFEKIFSQSYVAPKVGVLRIVKEVLVKNAVAAFRLEHLGPINQEDSRVPSGNIADHLAKRFGTTHRHCVALAGQDVLLLRFAPLACLFKEPRQAVVCLGKLRVQLDQLTVDLNGLGSVFRFQGGLV